MISRRIALLGLIVALAATLLTACGGGERRQVIQNKGSDTLVNVAQAWAEEYKEVDANVAVAVTGGGSGTGISSMINGIFGALSASCGIRCGSRYGPMV